MNELLKIISEIIDMNYTLMSLLRKLPPDEYNHYLPIVQKTIADNSAEVKTLLTHQK